MATPIPLNIQSSSTPSQTSPSPAPSARPAVRLRGFTRRFGANTILHELDLDIGAGEFVALLGRSGSGKTTLLRTLAGLDPVHGQDVETPTARAVVFQDPRLLPWKAVWKNVTLGLKGDAPRERAESALREVGLGHRLDAWPATLSGGEAQRAALARALVREPQLLLLDEPFAALDALTRLKMHELVLTLWRNHKPAVLLVTHDIDEAIALSDRVLVLDEGRIVAEEVIDAPRPRRGEGGLQAVRTRLLGHLGVEVHQTTETESQSVVRFPNAGVAAQ
ncbi:MAG: ABC transporter ATP-binding protein [Caulobacteraceae bacterium]|nr:ABC transporter ATP-binding protein [Caulobacteraceae bacterium]